MESKGRKQDFDLASHPGLEAPGLGAAKRIAKHLNDLGVPSPGAGRQRKDHGVLHRVTGKWGARTILELCRNCAIIGLKEYGVK